MNTISIQYCFRKLISEDNKFSKAVLYRKYNKIVTFSSKNDYQRKLIFGMSHIFEDIIFSKKIQLLWNKNAFENMFNKFIIIKKSCYLLHRHDYHVVKVNNMIIIVKKVFIYIIYFYRQYSKHWLSGKNTNSRASEVVGSILTNGQLEFLRGAYLLQVTSRRHYTHLARDLNTCHWLLY